MPTKETWQRYAFSSVTTFLAAFLATVLMDIDNISLESFGDGTINGILFVSVRAGVKALIELWVTPKI